MKSICFATLVVLLCAACGKGDDGTDAGPDPDSGGTIDMGVQDSGVQDSGGMVDAGPDVAEDVREIDWPMYSGEPCAVGGAAGVCLPTASCGGTSVPGHCPGPADIQCCVQSCEVGGGAGRCMPEASCGQSVTAGECSGPAGVGCCPVDGEIGTPLGVLWNTYYYLAVEANYSGADDTELLDVNCDPIATVPAAFSDSACIEGSGLLEDGTVVNYAATCDCGRPCPTGGTVCWVALDPSAFPWGMGARNNPLEPLRSIAVDRDVIALGTIVYLPEWDGFEVPSVDGLGGTTHDGCFRADDIGGAIDGSHIDIFAGTEGMWRALEQSFPTRTNLQAFAGADKCAYLTP